MESEGRLDGGRHIDGTNISTRDDGSECLTVVSSSVEETQRLGAALGRLLRPGDLILLQGPLGAGKTCFTQGIARGYGYTGRVISPSFTLANVYELPGGRPPLYHLDLWRIKSPAEALGLGLEEYISGGGVCVIEWPEIAETVLPYEYVRVRIEPKGDPRSIEMCAVGARPRALLEQLHASLPAEVSSGGAVAPRH
jgi:tRNA threonylcarbamoyladenosine biosynthesis protein TsaE